MIRTRHLTAALILAAALAGCSSDDEPKPAAATSTPTPPSTRAVSGMLTLQGPDAFAFDGSTCAGDGGYDDIHAGAQVVITDNAGATVALGKLGAGQLNSTGAATVPDACKFTFLISDVPTGKGYYGVEVSHRGKVQYPEAELFGALSLTLG